MVTKRKQHSSPRPVKQGRGARASRPNKIGASTPYHFRGKNLTPYGGLLPVATLLEKLDFQALLEETITTKRITRAMSPYQFVLALVLGLYVGFARLNQLRFIARDPILTGILKVTRLPPQSTLWDLVAWIIPKNVLSLVFSTLGIVQMPHKFNAARRHKFDKVQYRVINWAEYNESLRQRGDLTIWVSEEAQSVWSAPRRTSRGGQRRYSDLAIETCLTLRTTYRLALRQTQGLMGSIGTLMGLDIRVPDYSTLSRRANGVSIAQVMRQAGSVPIHLVVDSTGLKIFGEGEWLAQKHKIKVIRRRWRKLHLGLDLASGAIVCADLTDDDAGDSTALPGLLDQLDAPVTGFLADGAYDGASTRDLLRERYGETLDVVIPPPKNAVIRPQSARGPTVRDRHIAQIRSNGRMAWQAATGYNQRSRIETQIGRWKSVIGPKLKSRSFSRQITEITVGQKVLNTMTALGRPVFERIA